MRFSALLIAALLISCSDGEKTYGEYEAGVRDAYGQVPPGIDPAVAIVKRSGGIESWLATVHGYPNNREVCEQLIEPYNSNPEMSAVGGSYSCEAVAEGSAN